MSYFSLQQIEVAPCFDMELFMTLSQESRLGGDIAERLESLWESWLPALQVWKLKAEPDSQNIDSRKAEYLLLCLNEEVEKRVDAAWSASPAEGFRLNALAQTLCMSATRELLPEIEDAGCAPAPKPTEALAKALADAGVPYTGMGQGPTLTRRYALVTPYPLRGGCEICCLRHECPKQQASNVSSVLLPGHE